MKISITLLLLLISNSLFSQIEIGASVRPSIYLLPCSYMDEYSIMPNLDISIGDSETRAILSIGNYSRIGAQIVTEWFYTSATYNLILLSAEGRKKHGAAIELGFNYNIGSDCNRYRIQIGSALSLLGRFDADYTELILQPITISFKTIIGHKFKSDKGKYDLASK